MKKRTVKNYLAMLVMLLIPSMASAEIYYCAEEAGTGFKLRDGTIRNTNFHTSRYSIDVDLEDNRVMSEELGFNTSSYDNGDGRCQETNDYNMLVCSIGGNGFSINLDTLQFTYANFYPVIEVQDAFITHGKCEKF